MVGTPSHEMPLRVKLLSAALSPTTSDLPSPTSTGQRWIACRLPWRINSPRPMVPYSFLSIAKISRRQSWTDREHHSPHHVQTLALGFLHWSQLWRKLCSPRRMASKTALNAEDTGEALRLVQCPCHHLLVLHAASTQSVAVRRHNTHDDS